MKFSIDRKPLLSALDAVRDVVPTKHSVPILSNILIQASANALTLSVTDLDMYATSTVPAHVMQEGSTTVSAGKLYEIVRSLYDGSDLTFDATGVRATLTSGRSRFQLPQLPAEDFPKSGEGMIDCSFTMSAGAFSRLLSVGGFCLDPTDSRPYLQCAHLNTSDGKLCVVSTTGQWLALCEMPAPDGAADIHASLTQKTVRAIQAVLGAVDETDTVEVRMSENKIGMTAGSATMNAKLLDGGANYPDYRRLIPAKWEGRIRADMDLIAGAVNRASIMALETTEGRRVYMKAEAGQVGFRGANMDSGEGADEIDAELEGEEVSLAFVGPRLAEILSHVRAEGVLIAHTGPKGPMLITETDPGSDWLALLMPQTA